MSKVAIARWTCDRCGADGGVVDTKETLPFRWLLMGILVGTPQVAYEQRSRTIHFCHECGETLLFHTLTGQSDDIEQLKQLFKRERTATAYAAKS